MPECREIGCETRRDTVGVFMELKDSNFGCYFASYHGLARSDRHGSALKLCKIVICGPFPRETEENLQFSR